MENIRLLRIIKATNVLQEVAKKSCDAKHITPKKIKY